jgi:hypothetical protein
MTKSIGLSFPARQMAGGPTPVKRTSMIGNLFYKIFIIGLQEWQDKEGSKNPVNLVVEVYQKAGIY